MNSCIYNGIIKHQRFTPIKHSLNYNTFSLFVDLDEIESLTKNISLFGLFFVVVCVFILKKSTFVL